jgi:hypothetical protein
VFGDGWCIVMFKGWRVYSPPMHGDSIGSVEADARLISAAPELYDALSCTRGQWIDSVNAEKCLNALAKAEGAEISDFDRMLIDRSKRGKQE